VTVVSGRQFVYVVTCLIFREDVCRVSSESRSGLHFLLSSISFKGIFQSWQKRESLFPVATVFGHQTGPPVNHPSQVLSFTWFPRWDHGQCFSPILFSERRSDNCHHCTPTWRRVSVYFRSRRISTTDHQFIHCTCKRQIIALIT